MLVSFSRCFPKIGENPKMDDLGPMVFPPKEAAFRE